MKEKIIIACDISKDKLDLYCLNNEEHFVLPNSTSGMEDFDSWLLLHDFNLKEVNLVFEHTGSYGKLLEKHANKLGLRYFQISPLEIKLSQGIARGKNDKIDSKRIATYFKEKGYKLMESKLDSPEIESVKLLRSSRDFLVKQRASIKTNLKNLQVYNLPLDDLNVVTMQNLIKVFTSQIDEIEVKIQEYIKSSKKLTRNMELLQSIPGVGKIIAMDTILATGNFTKFKTWRQYASYCGCAPFPKQSGRMEYKNRISHLARKDLKAHLSSGAKSAMHFDQEMKTYTSKKQDEGKTKMCITNAIRCKLISRMFAVIQKNTLYTKNYQHNLAI